MDDVVHIHPATGVSLVLPLPSRHSVLGLLLILIKHSDGFVSVLPVACGCALLQVPQRVLHGLGVRRYPHQRDAHTAQLADVDEFLDRFHQLLRTDLPVSHHSLAACSVPLVQPVVKEAVDGQHVGSPDGVRIALARCIVDHHADGIGLVGRATAEE